MLRQASVAACEVEGAEEIIPDGLPGVRAGRIRYTSVGVEPERHGYVVVVHRSRHILAHDRVHVSIVAHNKVRWIPTAAIAEDIGVQRLHAGAVEVMGIISALRTVYGITATMGRVRGTTPRIKAGLRIVISLVPLDVPLFEGGLFAPLAYERRLCRRLGRSYSGRQYCHDHECTQ